tara:strand:+ start:240 stop:572 length:333 start_codon:yes stop_codon:yes gene_type:complete
MILQVSILFLLLLVIFFYYNNEDFLGYNMSKNFKSLNLSDKNCAFYSNIDNRREYNKYINDFSNILEEKRLNKPLRDVNELMNYECDAKNIYDYTSVNNCKIYKNNLDFW